jgi:hypothetical protein
LSFRFEIWNFKDWNFISTCVLNSFGIKVGKVYRSDLEFGISKIGILISFGFFEKQIGVMCVTVVLYENK